MWLFGIENETIPVTRTGDLEIPRLCKNNVFVHTRYLNTSLYSFLCIHSSIYFCGRRIHASIFKSEVTRIPTQTPEINGALCLLSALPQLNLLLNFSWLVYNVSLFFRLSACDLGLGRRTQTSLSKTSKRHPG